jgi:hypothetical protein
MSTNFDNLFSEMVSSAGASPASADRRALKPRDRVLDIARRASIPDDVADDFMAVTGLESGHSHTDGRGNVRLSAPDPKTGERAVGYSQIKPSTIKKYNLDPYDEDQNIEGGLRYFHEGSADDPVARRIYYFGGPRARRFYLRTGKVPKGKDANGVTFDEYLKRTKSSQQKPSQPSPQPKFDELLDELSQSAAPGTEQDIGQDIGQDPAAEPHPLESLLNSTPSTYLSPGKGPTMTAEGLQPPTPAMPDPESNKAVQDAESDTYVFKPKSVSGFTGNYGKIVDYGPEAEKAYLEFVRRNVNAPGDGKPVAMEKAAQDETLAGTFLRIQHFLEANPKASRRQQSRYLADLGIEFLKTPETDGKLLPKVLHAALLDGHLSKDEVAELPENLQKQIRQRQAQNAQAYEQQRRQQTGANLRVNDASWHFGMTPDQARGLSSRALRVLSDAVAEDNRKKAAGQTIAPPSLRYQNEMRAKAGLKKLDFNMSKRQMQIGDISIDVPASEDAVSPYYKPESGKLPVLQETERRGSDFYVKKPTMVDEELDRARQRANLPQAPDDGASLKAALRQQVIAEREASKPSGLPTQRRAALEMARDSEPGTAVEDEVERRYKEVQSGVQERQRLWDSMKPAEKDQWTKEMGGHAGDVLSARWPGVATAWKEFRAKTTRVAAGFADLASKLPGDSAWEKQLADKLRSDAQAMEDAVSSVSSVAPLTRRQEAFHTATSLLGELVINSPAMLNPVAGFAAIQGLESSGRNESLGKRLTATGKGALLGSVFELAGAIGAPGKALGPVGAQAEMTTAQHLALVAKQAGTIGAGTFGIETAFGTPLPEALKAAVTTMGLYGIFRAPDVGGKVIGIEARRAGRGEGPIGEALPENLRAAAARVGGETPIYAYTESGRFATVTIDPKTGKATSFRPLSETEFQQAGKGAAREAVEIPETFFDDFAKQAAKAPAQPAEPTKAKAEEATDAGTVRSDQGLIRREGQTAKESEGTSGADVHKERPGGQSIVKSEESTGGPQTGTKGELPGRAKAGEPASPTKEELIAFQVAAIRPEIRTGIDDYLTETNQSIEDATSSADPRQHRDFTGETAGEIVARLEERGIKATEREVEDGLYSLRHEAIPDEFEPIILPKAKTPKEVIEAAGYVYKGEQQRPKGKPSVQLFDAPDGSTLAIEGDVTPETVAAKIAEHQAKPKPKAEPVAEGTPRDRVRGMMNRWESEDIKTVDDLVKEAKTHASEPAVAKAIERYEADITRWPDDVDRHGDRLINDLHRASALPLKSGALPNENGVFDEKSPGIEIIRYESGKLGAKGATRPRAYAKIRVAELADGSWVSTASQNHNQGNYEGASGPLSSTSDTFKTREEAIHNAAEEIVYRQEKIAVATDSVATDNQRAEAKKMAEWARKVMADNPKKEVARKPVLNEELKTGNTERETTYVKGDLAEYTGKEEMIAGGKFYEVEMIEGASKGQKKVVKNAPKGSGLAAADESEKEATAEGFDLAEIKRRLPVGFDESTARIVGGKIMATEKPEYGGRQMWVSLKKATATPVEGEIKNAETDTAKKQPTKARAEQQPTIREPRPPKSPTIRGKETRVKIPGTDRGYDARYTVREADDVVPSHDHFNFQPNPDYHHVNDRRYDKEQQYQTQVMNRSSATGPEPFDPAYEINNSPTAENGPPVIDSDGNVLGGNSRAMIIKRVLEGENTTELQRAYRQMLFEQALGYGIDPGLVMAMKKPMLVREVDDAKLETNAGIQKAITELNVAGVTPLTHEEKSAAAASQISESAAQFLTDMIEVEGEDATIASVMDRKGVAIVNRLIEDGIFTPGERDTLLKDDKPTAEAKARVEKLLVSGIYRDLAQMESTPAGARRNIERIVIPMRRIAGTDWDLAEPVRGAIDAIIEARATGQDLDKIRIQQSMVREPFTDEEIALAKVLMMGPRKTADRFRAYAGDYQMEQEGGGLFGAPPRGESAGQHLGIDREVSTSKRLTELADPRVLTQDLLAAMRYEYRHGTLFINPETAEILRRVMTFLSGSNYGQFAGLHFNTTTLEFIRDLLRGFVSTSFPEQSGDAKSFAKALKIASKQSEREGGDGNLVVVVMKNESPMAMRDTIAHEGAHKSSDVGAKGKGRRERVDVDALMKLPVTRKIMEKLQDYGYHEAADAMLIEEAQAWLQTKDGAERLNVSLDEAVEFLSAWYKSFAEINGPDAILQFRRIRPASRKVRDSVYQSILESPRAQSSERAQSSNLRSVPGQGRGGAKGDTDGTLPEGRKEGSEGGRAELDDTRNRELAKELPPTREQSFEKHFGAKPTRRGRSGSAAMAKEPGQVGAGESPRPALPGSQSTGQSPDTEEADNVGNEETGKSPEAEDPTKSGVTYPQPPEEPGRPVKLAVPMPELIELARAMLGGKLPQIGRRLKSSLGLFKYLEGTSYREILIKPDTAKNEYQLAQVLAHEIGHLNDFIPENTIRRGNILGRIGSLRGYLKHYLGGFPGGASILTDKERARLHREAKKAATKTFQREVEEEIEQISGLTPDDVKRVFSHYDSSRPETIENEALYEYIKRLPETQKVAIARAVMKNMLPDELKRFANVVRIKTGRTITIEEPATGDILAEWRKLIDEEIRKRWLLSRELIQKELIDLTKWWSGDYSPASREYRESSKELYAEALSVFLNAPQQLKARAPEFYRGLMGYLERKPVFMQTYLELQEILNGSPEDVAKNRSERIDAMFDEGDAKIMAAIEARKAARQSVKESIKQFLEQYILDVHAPVNKRLKKIQKTSVRIRDDNNAMYVIDELNMIDNPNHAMLDRIQREVYEPILKEGMSREDIGEYLLMRRVINERNEIANPLGFTPSAAGEQLGAMKTRLGDEKFDKLEALMQRWHEIIFDRTVQAVAHGVYSQSAFTEKIEPNKENYATFAVIKYLEDYIPAGLKNQVGTFEGVANPFDATTLKMITLNRLIELNRAKNSVRDLLQTSFSDEISHVDLPYGAKEPTKQPKDGFEHIAILEDGKLEWYEVPKEIALAFQMHDVGGLARIAGILQSAVYKVFHPLFVSFNPGFIAANPFRDFRRTAINLGAIGNNLHKDLVAKLLERGYTKEGAEKAAKSQKITLGQVMWAYWKSVPVSYRRARGVSDELIDRLFEERVLTTPFVDVAGETGITSPLERLLKQHGLVEVEKSKRLAVRGIRALLDGIEAIGVFQETSSKVAGYNLLSERGVPPRERSYIVRKYVGTPDFKQRGLATPVTNSVLMYSRVRWNGMQADMRLGTDPKTAGGYWWRRVVWSVIPTMLKHMALLGLFGITIKEMMDRIPRYLRDAYDVIPLGFVSNSDDPKDMGKVLFLTIPQDDLGQSIGIITSKMLEIAENAAGSENAKTKEQLAHDIYGEAWGQLVPNVNPVLDIGWKWSQYAAGINPQDSHFNEQIVSKIEWEAGGWAAARKMMAWTVDKFGVVSTIVHPIAGPLLGRPYGVGNESTTEVIASSIPGLSRLVRVSDKGLSEEEWLEIENEDREKARFRLGLPTETRRLTVERYRMMRQTTAGKDLSAVEIERKAIVDHWYSAYYLPLVEEIKNKEAEGESAAREREALSKISDEVFNDNISDEFREKAIEEASKRARRGEKAEITRKTRSEEKGAAAADEVLLETETEKKAAKAKRSEDRKTPAAQEERKRKETAIKTKRAKYVIGPNPKK